MAVILALENALEKRIKYSLGHSAVIFSLAQDFQASGRVAENVNVIVRFAGSTMEKPMPGGNLPFVRVKRISFDVIIRYKQTQRDGYSFALAMLDTISNAINGFIPDLSETLGNNPSVIPQFQTGFELKGEKFEAYDDNSIYAYIQTYDIVLLQSVGQASPVSCPIEYNKISLKDVLPCKRCLKTINGVNIGIAEYSGPCFEGIPIFVFDTEECPVRPQDKLDIEFQEELGDDLYNITLKYTPYEAITYEPGGGITIDDGQVIHSSLERYYFHPSGNLPDECVNFSIIFRVWGDTPPPVTKDIRDAIFIDEVSYKTIL